MRFLKWLFDPIPDYSETTDELLIRRARESGLDADDFAAWLDKIRHLPSEPGSLGPGDPGRLPVRFRHD